MKKFLILLSILCCGAYADTINLHWLNADGTTYQNSTCTVDSDLNIPTTPPTKYGYTFTGWKISNYIPIEYLESTGTQWTRIPGINTDEDFSIITKIKFTELPRGTSGILINPYNKGLWFGAYDRQDFVIRAYNYQTYFSTPITTSTIYTINFTKNSGQYTININDNISNINNVTYLYNANSSAYFFTDGYTATLKAKLYYLQIYYNSVLVHDFIPVLDMNGTPCMFDKVESKFYYNQGTGQFVAGPVLQ